jgi:acetylornithine/N-succinyldiaminopimelate aminotransferase
VIPAVMPTYDRRDVAFERGEGCYLFASDGRRYLDFCSGIAVTALGHAHPHLVAAIKGQAEKLWHTSNLVRIPEGERLAKRLVENSFADTVFFCNSGAEAMEGGIKLVRKYHDVTGNPHRFRIIACTQSFHGRTLSTLAAAGNEKYLKGFDPAMPGFSQVPFGNLNVLRDEISDDVAAILVEPVQGDGGFLPVPDDFFVELRRIATQHGIVLIADEIQTGFGRTGKMFGFQHSGIEPDLVTVAKSLAGGLPLSAVRRSTGSAGRHRAGAPAGEVDGDRQATRPRLRAPAAQVLGDR